MDTLPQILGLAKSDVRKRIVPFLDALRGYAAKVPDDTDVEELFRQEGSNQELVSSLLNWSTNQIHLQRIKVISKIVTQYNRQRDDILSPSNKYTGLVNSFLKDSGKSIDFDERGYLYVRIDGIDDAKPISFLSSGEAQIFVILTHLSFNNLAQKNVFIIDEPELSLHIRWQEMFVEGLLSANPNIQYIMATHSPSIILERIKSCVDISRKEARRSTSRRVRLG